MIETEQKAAIRHENTFDSINFLKENQFEALKSLATLLLSIVELLEKTPTQVDELLNSPGINLVESTQQYEKELIRAALIKTNGSQRRAAKMLGTRETTLNFKIKRYGIDRANQNCASQSKRKK